MTSPLSRHFFLEVEHVLDHWSRGIHHVWKKHFETIKDHPKKTNANCFSSCHIILFAQVKEIFSPSVLCGASSAKSYSTATLLSIWQHIADQNDAF